MTLLTHSLAFLLGVALAAGVGGSRDLWLALAWAWIGLRVLRPQWQGGIFREPLRAHPLTAAALVAWGAARFMGSLAPLHNPHHIAFYAAQHPRAQVRVMGTVVRPPRRVDADTWALVVAVARVRPLDAAGSTAAVALQGRVYVRLDDPRAATWGYGDQVLLRGRLMPLPTKRAGYRAYLARLGAGARLEAYLGRRLRPATAWSFWRVLYALRARAHALTRQYWPAPEAPLFAGILLGLEDDIHPALYDAFRATGTAHIIVISGFNITVLAGLIIRLTQRTLGRSLGALAAAGGIAAYTLLVGADPAVVRAALMGGLGLLARQVGRQQHGLTTLAFSAAVMVAAQPWALWDIGFQLSFAATLGLMLYAAPLGRAARRLLALLVPSPGLTRVYPWVEEFFLLTLAAQIPTLPLSAYYFHRVSPVALVANPLILPAQGPLMVLGGLALLVGLLVEPFGQAVAWAAWPWAAYTIRVVDALAQAPFASWHVGYWGIGGLAAVYALLAGLTWLGWQHRWRALWHPAWLALALAALNLALWTRWLSWPDGWLHVWFLPVPRAAGVLIQFPRGARVLVNGGADPAALDHALGRVLGPGTRHLDVWVVTSNQDADVGALADLVARYPPRWVWWAPVTGRDPGYRRLRVALQARAVPIVALTPGAALTDGTARLTATQVTGPAANLALTWRSFRAVLAWHAPTAPQTATVALWGGPSATPPDLRAWLGLRGEPESPWPTVGTCGDPAAWGGVHVWTDGRTWAAAVTHAARATTGACPTATQVDGRAPP